MGVEAAHGQLFGPARELQMQLARLVAHHDAAVDLARAMEQTVSQRDWLRQRLATKCGPRAVKCRPAA